MKGILLHDKHRMYLHFRYLSCSYSEGHIVLLAVKNNLFKSGLFLKVFYFYVLNLLKYEKFCTFINDINPNHLF